MKLDIGEGLMYVCFWIIGAIIILGPIWMYHNNKDVPVPVHYYVPAEHKEAADKMWMRVYEETNKESSNGYATQYATDAVNATYGVPYIVKDNRLEISEDYVPPTLPSKKKDIKKEPF